MTRTTFIVISEGADGGHIAGTLYAADLYDARQTHHDSYANEPLVAFHQQRHRGTPPFAAMASHEPSGIWAGEGPDRHLTRSAVEAPGN